MRGGGAGDWRPVVAYAALSGANQMLWLTYAPITTDAARHYGVSTGAIGWLAEIFPLLYVVLALPAGRLVERRLPLWLGAGAVLTASGGAARLGGAYGAVLAGQVLVAVAQPLVLNAVTRVSRDYLREQDRAKGIAISSAGTFAGMVVALTAGAAFGGRHVDALVDTQAAVALACALGLLAALRRRPRFGETAGSVVPIRVVWRDRYVRLLLGLVCIGFGVFVALTTWLQALLDPAGVSETGAGILLVVLVVAGVAGCAVVPPLLARRRGEPTFVVVSFVGTAVGMLVLAAAPGLATGLPVSAGIGVLLLTDLPIALELAARRAPHAGATVSALIWLAGNAAGLLVALGVQALKGHPPAAFALMAAVGVAGVPVVFALRRVPLSPPPAAEGPASSSAPTAPGRAASSGPA